ncbi:MAG TPA: restriction endonuclease [archaeon]|nr:restriction endonuclease [archaeon]
MMEKKDKQIFGFYEKAALIVIAFLVAVHLLFWQAIQKNPLISVAFLAGAFLLGLGYWLWRNYRIIKPEAEKPAPLWEKLEAIIQTLFLPQSYEIMTSPFVDEENTGWAVLRDSHGIPVVMQYLEMSLEETVGEERLQPLVERMGREMSPKGISLTTSVFTDRALQFARKNNILTKDSDQLMEMIQKSEKETRGGQEYFCSRCGTELVENKEITGYMVCPNPDCRKVFPKKELKELKKKKPEELKTFTITCYSCNRPVELDTRMSGLVECPYEDCSWIINVDNEILALRGGLDKKISERLAEIKCPKCDKTIRVPADAEGLIECPCEEKWIIDVGAALGERAQTQIAEGVVEDEKAQAQEQRRELSFNAGAGIEYLPVSKEGLKIVSRPAGQEAEEEAGSVNRLEINDRTESTTGLDSESVPPGETSDNQEVMVDCPGCGAGVPAHLQNCPVCGTGLQKNDEIELELGSPDEVDPPLETVPLEKTPVIKHRHAFLSLNTIGLLVFFVISITAFLIFVYFIAR